MANTERLRIPANVFSAVKAEAKGSMSKLIEQVMTDYVSGKCDLRVEPEVGTKDTSIVADEGLIKAVKDYAVSKGLSFNKAVVMMLEQRVLHH